MKVSVSSSLERSLKIFEADVWVSFTFTLRAAALVTVAQTSFKSRVVYTEF